MPQLSKNITVLQNSPFTLDIHSGRGLSPMELFAENFPQQVGEAGGRAGCLIFWKRQNVCQHPAGKCAGGIQDIYRQNRDMYINS